MATFEKTWDFFTQEITQLNVVVLTALVFSTGFYYFLLMPTFSNRSHGQPETVIQGPSANLPVSSGTLGRSQPQSSGCFLDG